MGNRSSQRYVADPLTPYLGIGDLYSAAVADNTLVSVGFELSAPAFPGLCGSEDTLAEKTIPLRAERTLVDGLRLLHLSIGPGKNLLR